MDTTQNIAAKSTTIKDIELRIEKQRKFPVARQFYVEFSVGDTLRSTEIATEANNRTSWDKPLYFVGDGCSVLLVQLYEQYRIGNPKLVGSFSDTIGDILGKLKDGVLEATLRKDIPDEPDLSEVVIKFTLTAEPREEANADECHATDAVTLAQATVTVHDSPAVIATPCSVVDVSMDTTPMITYETTLGVLSRRMEIFNKIVNGIPEIHSYASLAWSVISVASDVLLAQKNRDDRIIRLAGAMSDVFAFVEDAEPLKRIEAHMKTVIPLLQQVTECGYFITEYPKANFRQSSSVTVTTTDFCMLGIWMAKYKMSNIDARITDYETKLQELKTSLLEGVLVQTEITVIRMVNVIEHVVEAIDLYDMPYAPEARYAQEKGCLPGTRESFLAEICDILNNVNEGAPQVCLLTGVAGSGKSAVAHSIARLYDGQKRLGSSYCFARSNASRNPENLFGTIARDLSDLDPQYKSVFCGIVKENRALRASTSPSRQLEKLIIEPSQHLRTIGPLVIVIDALDESGDSAGRRQLLQALSTQIANNNLPTNLRFLITTRPESDILAALPPGPQIVHKQMSDIPDNVVDGDIYKFIRHSLHQYTELESSWPNEEWCWLLVRHSQHLFQWASTACSFIKGFGIGLNPGKRLEILLQTNNSNGVSPLDELYRSILWQLFASERSQRRFRDVMTVILALKEPLPLPSLSTLFGGYLEIQDVIPVLASLLDGVLDEQRPIRPLHPSFRDFLLHKACSLDFHVHTLPKDSLSLGCGLLSCMQNMLSFNICNLKDSRLRNSDIPDLPSRVSTAIPAHLSYSCQCWMYHLQHAKCDPVLLDAVTVFFKKFFPYWLEAISLLSLSSPLSSIPSAIEACTILKDWAKGQEIATLASEACLHSPDPSQLSTLQIVG
ncbi:hypothetical protein JVT61DRAFT_4810 [Boletus reticuloceps]|uniref:AAA+ ATPase domain-containing protein n=1 Tax=Boletus reticuloceps TaxID=495285 RepID=A0A8I2YLS7_9AGAM|nr:hypothetical protein JVT61DRAFT_4810 [Boletus reticuloceps]